MFSQHRRGVVLYVFVKQGKKACADSEVQGAGTGDWKFFPRREFSEQKFDHSDWLTTANSNTDVNRTARKTEQKRTDELEGGKPICVCHPPVNIFGPDPDS